MRILPYGIRPPSEIPDVADRILLDLYWRRPMGFYAAFGSVKYKAAIYPIPAPEVEYLNACYGEGWTVNDPNNNGTTFEG